MSREICFHVRELADRLVQNSVARQVREGHRIRVFTRRTQRHDAEVRWTLISSIADGRQGGRVAEQLEQVIVTSTDRDESALEQERLQRDSVNIL